MSSISVITICFNNFQDVIKTNSSVDIQNLKPFEHIIIDGSTKSNIKNYLNENIQPPYRKWISEPDNGIADAFNKGIKIAKGDILVMLNSGDVFFNELVLELVTKKFDESASIKWLHGKYNIHRGNRWVIIGKSFEKRKLYRGMRSVCHQTMFIKKELHNKYGLYDKKEKIAMDYDFLCRIANEKFAFLPTPLIIYNPEGISSSNYLLSLKHAKKIYEKYFGKSFKLILWQKRLKFLYYILQSPLGNFLYKIKTKLNLENM